MSAICGHWTIQSRTGSQAPTGHMLDALIAHGPDRVSVYPSLDDRPEPFSLGHRLLAITSQDHLETQPLLVPSHTPGASCWLVADARIDNRSQLATLLDIPAREIDALPDSAFVLKAWQRWGQNCVQYLIGGFALAVWEPHAQHLFLARDHAGERPLYYRSTPDSFAFASTARALRTLPGASSDLDERQLARDLMGLPPDATATRFREISAIPAGHSLSLTRQSFAQPAPRRYWQITGLTPVRFARDEDYVAAFLEIFDEAVQCRLRTTGRIATELSAGLDSSAVTATAARLLAGAGQTLDAFTAVPCPAYTGPVPRGLIADEGPYAAQVAALSPNVTHHRIDSTGSDMLRELNRIFPFLDLPHAAALNNVWSSRIHDQAAASGANVMLCGALGNFTVSYSGSDILHQTFRSNPLATLPQALHLRRIGLSSGRNAVSLTLFSLLPWPLRRRVDPLVRSQNLRWTALNSAAAMEFYALDQLRRYHFERESDLPHLMETQFQRNQYGDYNAATAARWRIETRDPTADRRVFEFCAAIPPEQFLVGNQGRSLIRRAMRHRLPQSTLERTEKGTQAADWYQTLTPIRAELAAELGRIQQSPVARRLLDIEQLRSALAAWPASAEEAARSAWLYQSAIPRGIAVGYFIRRIEAESTG